MGKFKWILVAGALLALFSGQMMAGPGSDTRVFFDEEMTTNASAVIMGFAADLTTTLPPSRTSMAISNTMGAPDIDGLVKGGDTEGPVWLFCYNTLSLEATPTAAGVEPIVVNTGAIVNPHNVGVGLDSAGNLVPGSTWLVYLDEAFDAIGYDQEFVGYCFVIGEFDAITGFNISEIGNGAVGLAMTKNFGGVPVVVMPVATPQ